jgi:hypothetical protein
MAGSANPLFRDFGSMIGLRASHSDAPDLADHGAEYALELRMEAMQAGMTELAPKAAAQPAVPAHWWNWTRRSQSAAI